MDLQDGVANVSICSPVIEEVADDSLLQIEEIAVGSLEMSDLQWSRR